MLCWWQSAVRECHETSLIAAGRVSVTRKQAFEALLTFEMDFDGSHFTELSEGARDLITSLLQVCFSCYECIAANLAFVRSCISVATICTYFLCLRSESPMRHQHCDDNSTRFDCDKFGMLQEDASKRPTAAEALQHHWIQVQASLNVCW